MQRTNPATIRISLNTERMAICMIAPFSINLPTAMGDRGHPNETQPGYQMANHEHWLFSWLQIVWCRQIPARYGLQKSVWNEAVRSLAKLERETGNPQCRTLEVACSSKKRARLRGGHRPGGVLNCRSRGFIASQRRYGVRQSSRGNCQHTSSMLVRKLAESPFLAKAP